MTFETKTFVYNNVEVTRTGRTAEKKLGSGRVDKLFEITPIDKFDGTWKKWVRDAELFDVNEDGPNE